MDLRRKLRRKASPAFSDYADRLITEPFSMKRENLQACCIGAKSAKTRSFLYVAPNNNISCLYIVWIGCLD